MKDYSFNEQRIDIHVKNISKKIKLAFQQYYQDLGFEILNEKADMKMDEKYYAAQKIIFYIILWKPNKFLINRKLLNEEVGIIQFIVDRIYDNNLIFVNLKSRLFRLIQSSKVHIATNIATIINVARFIMSSKTGIK
ncbi:hypothetical protein RFI_37544 [Reticulomyxa filosa]|uniref:Uncharacterized protein n=1 Tax=Reticulomyxa filosa TaxID=46433 RepID=X6LEG0_RETFI|nr:hypothetical protein RFI_37544 [Reticulomyxa filosa]|eukprot:ETN99923.1 hypothetical protein RFI_37544 [Reticulomyxa filosa]